jgi:hypothetical protein
MLRVYLGSGHGRGVLPGNEWPVSASASDHVAAVVAAHEAGDDVVRAGRGGVGGDLDARVASGKQQAGEEDTPGERQADRSLL